jgi:hypothetical protein
MVRWRRLMASVAIGTAVSMAGFVLFPLLGWGGLLMEGLVLAPGVAIVDGIIEALLTVTRPNRMLYGWAYHWNDYYRQAPLAFALPLSIFLYTILSYWLLGLSKAPPKEAERHGMRTY